MNIIKTKAAKALLALTLATSFSAANASSVTTVCWYTPEGAFVMGGIEKRYSGDVSCPSGFGKTEMSFNHITKEFEKKHFWYSLVHKRLE